MSSRRPKRASNSLATPTPSRSTRGLRVKYEPGETDVVEDVSAGATHRGDGDGISESDADDAEEGADGNSDLTPEPGPSRRSTGRSSTGRGGARSTVNKNLASLKRKRDLTATGSDEDEEAPKSSRRVRKSVSYKEIPVDEALEAEADEEDVAQAEVDDEAEDEDGGECYHMTRPP